MVYKSGQNAPHLEGEAYLVRYIDDFVICFQYQSDAMRVQNALSKRLIKFGLQLEPNKTKLVEFGRFAERDAGKRGRNRPETLYFLGFTVYCTRNLKGNYKVGSRTEKSRLKRSLTNLCDLMKRIRHLSVKDKHSILTAYCEVTMPTMVLLETYGLCKGFTEMLSVIGGKC